MPLIHACSATYLTQTLISIIQGLCINGPKYVNITYSIETSLEPKVESKSVNEEKSARNVNGEERERERERYQI